MDQTQPPKQTTFEQSNANYVYGESPATPVAASKDFQLTVLLASMFGYLGVHRFYMGKVGTGILMLLTWGGFLIWSSIDVLALLKGNLQPKNAAFSGPPLSPHAAMLIKIVTWILMVFCALAILGWIVSIILMLVYSLTPQN